MTTYLFDFDGTLADSFSLVCDIFLKESKHLGCNLLSLDEIEKLRNMHAREMLRYIGVPFWRIPDFVKKLRVLGSQRINEVMIFPGWVEVLTVLKNQKHTLGIISSNSAETIESLLKKCGMNELFDYVFAGKSLFGKGRCLKKVMRKLNLTTDDVCYIGDEVRDIEAAHANKIYAIAVSWGFNSIERLKLANPQLLISSPKELFKANLRN